jgi:hypothetical protein
MQSLLISCYLFPFETKYFPQHPVLGLPQPMSFYGSEGSRFTSKQETGNVFLTYILKLRLLKDGETKSSLTEDKKLS